MEGDCGYCYQAIHSQDYLECVECEQYIHIKCLKRPGTPGDFSGDVFFQFKCVNCTVNGLESFVRQRLPWAVIIALTIHNLSINSTGLSHHGYFHWRTHIVYFIDKNWAHIMGPNVKRRKKWIGTISGTLSHNSPSLFTSGSNVFNESGWWKLTQNVSPMKFYELFKKLRREKGVDDVEGEEGFSYAEGMPPAKKSKMSISTEEEECVEESPVFSRTLPYMGCVPYMQKAIVKQEPGLDIFDFMDSNSYSEFLDDIELEPNKEDASIIPSFRNCLDGKDWKDNLVDWVLGGDNLSPIAEEEVPPPKVVQVTNFQEPESVAPVALPNVKRDVVSRRTVEPAVETEEEEVPYDIKYKCKKSLFTVSTPATKLPWEGEGDHTEEIPIVDDFSGDKNIELMSEYEENETYQRLKVVMSLAERNKQLNVPTWIRRYYRKLCVRRGQRSLGKPMFDLDNFNKIKQHGRHSGDGALILDRFHQLISCTGSTQARSLHARLSGACHYEMFVSPHTGRVLHPFIHRNDQCLPQWTRLMCELQYVVNEKMPSRSSVDYCYVRPQHIAAVNALLQRMFWPGIDMSECLSYPDFSVVALYKKLVIGCAFLVPDVCHNEAYISFMAVRPGWQRAGIAKFMLYHLIQTCMGKDITLHVSANNPAICLYQKFGFKIEELILDFYDKFLPIDSTQSRHAFLLRMER